jgi:outer membrane protein assembly factor BamB
MKQKVLLFVIFAFGFCMAEAQFPEIKWWFDTHDASFGQTAAGDIDKDGKPEVVFGCYRNDSCVYALNAEDGSLLWKYNTHPFGAEGCNDVAPVIYDIDGDDSLEVIVASSCNPKTFCFRGSTGIVQWQTPTAGSDSPPTIADIDNDGKPEILHGGFDGHVLCINGENGSVSWSLTVNNNSWIQTAPTVVDADSDGQLDFVVGTWAFGSDTNKVYAFRGNDHSLIWSEPVPDVIYHGTAVSDLDEDGKPELIIGDYDGILYVFNAEDGSDVWQYQADYYIGAPAAVADLDNDGKCEIVFCDAYGVGSLSGTGGLDWYYTIPDYGTAFRGVAIADINGDNIPDLAFGTSTGRAIVLNGSDGSVIWSLDLATHYGKAFEIDHAPVIADFDNDGTMDVFLVGGHAEYPNFQNNYGRGYMISAGIGTGPAWLMFQHDPRRQSSLCGNPVTSITEEAGNTVQQMSVYPNPGIDRITIESMENGYIEILTLQGRTVSTLKAEGKQTPVDISALTRGVYIIKLITDKGMAVQKFIKQ